MSSKPSATTSFKSISTNLYKRGLGDMYNFKMFLYLFPFLFSMTAFLLKLNNGDIINSIFFFFGLLLTILLGYIFKVLKIGTKKPKELGEKICGVILPNSLFEISTISISQLFYGYILSYIFMEKGLELNMIPSFVFLMICWLFDAVAFYKNKCSDINEILFGFLLGIFLGILMLMVKKRYYGIEEPYKKPECSLKGNKFRCKKTEEKKTEDKNKDCAYTGSQSFKYEKNYDCALGERRKKKFFSPEV